MHEYVDPLYDRLMLVDKTLRLFRRSVYISCFFFVKANDFTVMKNEINNARFPKCPCFRNNGTRKIFYAARRIYELIK